MTGSTCKSLAGALGLVLALGACGRDGDSSPLPAAAADARTACDLLTRETAADALGEAVDEPVEQIVNPGSAEMAALSQCSTQASAAPGKSLSLFFRRSPVADNQPDSVRGTLSDAGVAARDVAGVGDAAFWGASELHVFFDGNRYLIVGVRGFDDAAALERATRVAKDAITRARS